VGKWASIVLDRRAGWEKNITAEWAARELRQCHNYSLLLLCIEEGDVGEPAKHTRCVVPMLTQPASLPTDFLDYGRQLTWCQHSFATHLTSTWEMV
jgi:hypothetical protein